MKKSVVPLFLAVLLALSAIIAPCGCAKEEQPAPGPVMVEVYDDGLYTIDAGNVHTISEDDGSLNHLVRLHIANRTDKPLIISTLLGAYVECGGERMDCVSLHSQPSSGTDQLTGIDGLVAPGFYVDGWVMFPAGNNEDGMLTMSLAVDYSAGEWISFELPAIISDSAQSSGAQ